MSKYSVVMVTYARRLFVSCPYIVFLQTWPTLNVNLFEQKEVLARIRKEKKFRLWRGPTDKSKVPKPGRFSSANAKA